MKPPEQPFSPVRTSREIMLTAATGALATLDREGHPFASFVTVAPTIAGEPILLLSRLAVHTRNLERDRRASLLLVGRGGEAGDPLAGARLSLAGTVAAEDRPEHRRRFLARHPEAGSYAGFSDFGFYRFAVTGAHLVAGFGRIVDLGAADLLPDFADAAETVAAENEIVEHMNGEHGETVRLYAARLLGREARAWRVIGADPDGIDLGSADGVARLWFHERARTPGAVRRALRDLADQARRQ